ncbi:MAG: hypothetical protein AB1757_12040 [Acidobacteriota bacterium]
MKINKLKQRLHKDRSKTNISLKMPEDVVEDLKSVALRLGFSNYEALIRAYVGQGLRNDLARLEANPEISSLIDSLRKHGVDESVLASAMADATKNRLNADSL